MSAIDDVTGEDLHRLRHMLGATEDKPKSKWGYRNHYVAGGGGEAVKSMERLIAAGYVVQGRRSGTTSCFYHATEAGCKALGFSKAAIARALED